MALVDCPECGTKVSSAAFACPRCAFPMQQSTLKPTPTGQVVTTERTGKDLKAAGCFWGLLLVASVFVLISTASQQTVVTFLAWIATTVSLIALIRVKVLTWWRHG